jgi:hypothetical protein
MVGYVWPVGQDSPHDVADRDMDLVSYLKLGAYGNTLTGKCYGWYELGLPFNT